MDQELNILEQLNYSVSFILHRKKKIVEHKSKLDNYKGKPFYETLLDGISLISSEIENEDKILRYTLDQYCLLK